MLKLGRLLALKVDVPKLRAFAIDQKLSEKRSERRRSS